MGLEIGKKQRLAIMFLLTGIFMVTELIVGYCGGSLTLVADSFHMLSDVAALVIAFVSVSLSPKPWARSTFGWARVEVLGALINTVFLMALAFSILVEAMKRFLHPEPITEPLWILGVGVCGLIINLFGLILFKDHAHSHGIEERGRPSSLPDSARSENPTRAREDSNTLNGSQMNMRGVFLHLFADMMASVAVIVSAVAVWSTENLRSDDGLISYYIDFVDPALSILICVIIVCSTWPLLHQAALILLQAFPTKISLENSTAQNLLKKFFPGWPALTAILWGTPNSQTRLIDLILQVEEVHKRLNEIFGVRNVHNLYIWQLTGSKTFASVHLKCNDLTEYDQILKEATFILTSFGIESTTVQAEFDIGTRRQQGLVADDETGSNCIAVAKPPPSQSLPISMSRA